ncbi:MAG: hypothetical protein RMJ98_02480, partial [Myxococcales bacterium]|nr:hypothetical protein [Myxococcales bacterium]
MHDRAQGAAGRDGFHGRQGDGNQGPRRFPPRLRLREHPEALGTGGQGFRVVLQQRFPPGFFSREEFPDLLGA